MGQFFHGELRLGLQTFHTRSQGGHQLINGERLLLFTATRGHPGEQPVFDELINLGEHIFFISLHHQARKRGQASRSQPEERTKECDRQT